MEDKKEKAEKLIKLLKKMMEKTSSLKIFREKFIHADMRVEMVHKSDYLKHRTIATENIKTITDGVIILSQVIEYDHMDIEDGSLVINILSPGMEEMYNIPIL